MKWPMHAWANDRKRGSDALPNYFMLLMLPACGSFTYADSHDCAETEAERKAFAICINQPIFNDKTDLYKAIGWCHVQAWKSIRKQNGEKFDD